MSQQQYKTVVVLGERGVGKSAVVHRLLDDSNEKFDFTTYKPTIDDCYKVVWKLPADGKFVQVQLIDTAAWNEFPAMQSLYIKMSHLVIIVYDVVSPRWRDSLLTVINGVRAIKDDADIFVVGNKCDKLTVTDSFAPKDLSEVIGHSCVGHVYSSALTQQGIAGMKQLILCSKSHLTEGHYAEFSNIHKRKKLKKKLNGLALALRFIKTKEKEEQTDKIDGPVKYRQPVVYPREPHYIAYSDLTENNFDKLFDAAQSGRSGKDKMKVADQTRKPLPRGARRQSAAAVDAGFVSDYSSPGTSPSSSNCCDGGSTPNYHIRGHRRSMDFSYIMQESNPSPYSCSLYRQRSQSTGNDAGFKRTVDATVSVSTIMSDSSTDSSCSISHDSAAASTGRPSHRTVLVERVKMREKQLPSQSNRQRRANRSSALSTTSMESLEENDTEWTVGPFMEGKQAATINQSQSNGTTNTGRYHNPQSELKSHHQTATTVARNLTNLHIKDEPSKRKSDILAAVGKRESPARHRRHSTDGQVMLY